AIAKQKNLAFFVTCNSINKSLLSFPCYNHNKEKDNLSSKSLFDAYIFLYILELIFLTSDHINLN
ncbi:MAG: hypothetical protein E7G13_08485, partial [Enterococcus faecalis]|nr:hypothetical protein [Enterococcus faecalis]